MIGTDYVVVKSAADDMFRNSIELWVEFRVCGVFRNERNILQGSYKSFFYWCMTKGVLLLISAVFRTCGS